ncbi:siphovirus Gp157 family protein [Streptococcus ruminantium]|uniref:siphovirus Gp157 family protein n=1 Tax=Streptococcus ruminantium TaxID=1917441 RepID=UPI0012DF8F64|nr:siphovirus Gp157 family protein [Streptococcus ruminantium]
MNLYELNDKLAWLESLELDEETERDTIEAVIDDVGIEELLNNVAKANTNDKAIIKTAKQERQNLMDKIDSADKRIKSRNDIAFNILSKLKNKKLKTGLYNFWIQNNPISTEYDESKIPERYFRQVKELDKEMIKKDLNAGLEIEGVIQKQTEGVRIR